LPGETRNYVALVTGWTADEWASSSPPEKADTTIPQGVPCTRLANLAGLHAGERRRRPEYRAAGRRAEPWRYGDPQSRYLQAVAHRCSRRGGDGAAIPLNMKRRPFLTLSAGAVAFVLAGQRLATAISADGHKAVARRGLVKLRFADLNPDRMWPTYRLLLPADR
jgi:hypothetical protein